GPRRPSLQRTPGPILDRSDRIVFSFRRRRNGRGPSTAGFLGPGIPAIQACKPNFADGAVDPLRRVVMACRRAVARSRRGTREGIADEGSTAARPGAGPAREV